MINKISINQYRKLKNIELYFSKGINIISGTNGTCKTSLLHMISNSFQAVVKTSNFLKDNDVLDVIKGLNKLTNPKIESLARGDEKYNDPAPGVKGILYSCEYFNGVTLEFRRHNSGKGNNTRFSVKPKYTKNKNDSLPMLPVIYLGLFRLFSFGEFNDDAAIKDLGKKMPNSYLEEIQSLYSDFTGVEIKYTRQKDMGGIKYRAEFSTNKEGIDSNTISAGEDNLLIILTAVVSLKYYFENLQKEENNDVESILLIDEIDATLHPAFQIRLLDLFKEYSEKYKIQIVFTTHSISLLEYALKQNEKVIYLIDNIDSVGQMDSVDKYKIEMFLKNKAKKDIYLPKKIPILTEDNEARMFLKELFTYYAEKNVEFKNVVSLFHLVNVNIGAKSLINMFKDDEILRSTMKSVCILDGDQAGQDCLSNHILVLPGLKSPEELFFDYLENELFSDDDFWNNEQVQNQGFSKKYIQENILNKLEEENKKINNLKSNDKTTKGKTRKINKTIFTDNIVFFKFVMKNWLNNDNKAPEIKKFFLELNKIFKKVAEFHGINSNEWTEKNMAKKN